MNEQAFIQFRSGQIPWKIQSTTTDAKWLENPNNSIPVLKIKLRKKDLMALFKEIIIQVLHKFFQNTEEKNTLFYGVSITFVTGGERKLQINILHENGPKNNI